MRCSRSILHGLALAALFAGPALAGDDFTDTSARWEKAYNAGDAAAIATLYTEDGMVMPPHKAAAMGHKAIQESLEADLAANEGSKLEIVSVDSAKQGDIGYAHGTYRMTDAAGKVVDEGKWLEVRKMVKGKWLILRDIWNSDLPM
jgi:uncharacterized protein (TIGR02246 family)